MDDIMKIYVALGASSAANCRPCMEHHVGRARQAGIEESDIRIALELGMNVAKGAQAKTRDHVLSLTAANNKTETTTVAAGGSCC